MRRREILKFGLLSVLTAGAGSGFLKIYKRQIGVKKIYEYPAPILRKISGPVDVIDAKTLPLCRHMTATLRYHSLIGFFSKAFLSRGLAAPQVGISKRLIVCGLYGKMQQLINPEVIEASGTFSGHESCLSLPDSEPGIVMRPDFIKVKYRGLDSREYVLTAMNDYAALLAHEIDHLNGILYIDYKHDSLHT
jgi:peptide deformylase